MLKLGKVQILGNELDRLKVDVCSLSEVRWEGQGHFTTLQGHTVAYSGNEKQGQHGVAVWMHKRATGTMTGYEPICERIISVRLNAKQRKITLVQVYAPTTAATEVETEHFYEQLSRTLRNVNKGGMTFVIGDFNAKLGSDVSLSTGSFGLGITNEAGERLKDFCIEHELMAANTFFKQHPRWLYKWMSPDGQFRNQTDYSWSTLEIMYGISNCKTYPGANCDSDHNLLVASIKIQFNFQRKNMLAKKLNLEELHGHVAAE